MTEAEFKKIYEKLHNEAHSGSVARFGNEWDSLGQRIKIYILEPIRIAGEIKNLSVIKYFGCGDDYENKIIGSCTPENSAEDSLKTLKSLLEKTPEKLQSGELRYSGNGCMEFTVEFSKLAVDMLNIIVKGIGMVFRDVDNFTEEHAKFLSDSIDCIVNILREFTDLLDRKKQDIVSKLSSSEKGTIRLNPLVNLHVT